MFYGYAALLVFSTNVAVFLHRDMELVSILKEDLRVMEELNTHQQAINGNLNKQEYRPTAKNRSSRGPDTPPPIGWR